MEAPWAPTPTRLVPVRLCIAPGEAPARSPAACCHPEGASGCGAGGNRLWQLSLFRGRRRCKAGSRAAVHPASNLGRGRLAQEARVLTCTVLAAAAAPCLLHRRAVGVLPPHGAGAGLGRASERVPAHLEGGLHVGVCAAAPAARPRQLPLAAGERQHTTGESCLREIYASLRATAPGSPTLPSIERCTSTQQHRHERRRGGTAAVSCPACCLRGGMAAKGRTVLRLRFANAIGVRAGRVALGHRGPPRGPVVPVPGGRCQRRR